MEIQLGRICGIAFLCTVAVLLLKHIRPEFPVLIQISGGIVILGAVLLAGREAMEVFRGLFGDSGLDEYAALMLRAIGIALLCRICTDICRDCGAQTVAGGVETAGKVAILSLCIPLISEIIGYAGELLGFAAG